MTGDFSKWYFDRKNNFNGVLHQQGRVLLDSDWNDQTRIINDWQNQAGRDIIGPGVAAIPASDPDALEVKHAHVRRISDVVIISVIPGRGWVDGLAVCLECDKSKRVKFAATYIQDIDVSTIHNGIRDAVILEVWQEAVNGFQMPDKLIEPALGGPDTTERVHTGMALRLLRLEEGDTCENIREELKDDFSQKGKLKVTLQPPTEPDDVCPEVEGGGYTGFEHNLYRIEIAEVNDRIPTSFKWSQFNGGLVGLGTFDSTNNKVIITANLQAIMTSGLSEFYLEALDKDPDRDHWKVIYGINVTLNKNNELDLDPSSIFGFIPKSKDPVFFRLWNEIRKIGEFQIESGSEVEPHELYDGIRLEFDDPDRTDYKPGDYWTFPVRAGGIKNHKVLIYPQPPEGIHYHRVPLAILNWKQRNFKQVEITDCRQLFPPLNNITASDVHFDNERCQLPNAKTVQDALDNLCKWHWGGCTLVVTPGTGWEKIFDRIGDGQHAKICFQVGEYLLQRPLTLKNKGNIMISGCGAGTRIIAHGAETVFKFEDCKSVVVQDLYAESGVTGSGRGSELMHLNGTLNFCACPKVTVESVELKCAAGMERAASCINVHDDTVGYESEVPAKPVGPVRIHGCDLHVGHWQIGILLINVKRAYVEDNLIMVAKKPGSFSLPVMLQNKRYRSQVRRLMIYDPKLGKTENNEEEDVYISEGKGCVWFKTDTSLVDAWGEWIKQNPPKGVQSDRDLLSYLKKTANQVLINRGILDTGNLRFNLFKDWYEKIKGNNPAVGSQGIVVGGKIATGINILNNKIHGVLQGIHIGVSHHGAASEVYDMSGTVQIRGNNIQVSLPPSAQECHGIFIGNCDSLIIENNYATIWRFLSTSKIPIDGIRVYGHLGKMMIIRQNHLVGTTVGIKIKSLDNENGRPEWIVTDNVAPGASSAVEAPSEVRGILYNFK